MLLYMGVESEFGNPSSATHVYGQAAMQAIEDAKAQMAKVLHADEEAFVFTSGATEANNLAILGAARFYQRKGRHLVTLQTEHRSVLDPLSALEREGFEVTYLVPREDGLLDLDGLVNALRPDTILVSIMHVNNEIGVIQDIESIAALLQNRGILLHVDAAQSAGRLEINLQRWGVDLMSFSAHKNYGPKGIGALYIRQKPRIRLQPLLWGGGQQRGLRPGTLPVHQIVGMSTAFMVTEVRREAEQARLLAYRETLWAAIKALPGVQLNGHETQRVAGNLNVSFQGFQGASLREAWHTLALSSRSACSSINYSSSHVLRALGRTEEQAQSAVRFSMGRFTTEEDINRTIEIIKGVIV
jgi:cysteine desulfurase